MAACGTCGEHNPPSANFCLACGAALPRAAPAPPSARKTVTVLFADVAGSTRLGEQLDPESLRRVMSRWFEAMSDVIRAHGGAVEKFVGDAVMAAFGVPRLHEDDALRAVRAAVEMRVAVAKLNVELERDLGVELHIRTGINTGEVIAGDPGTGHGFVTGDAVNVAKRLEQAARPSEILIGETTRRLVENAALVEPRPLLSVKGKSDGVDAWALLAVIDGASGVARRLDAPLVGRGDELRALDAAFAEVVRERACRMVTIVGSAGIGKSRLAAELGRRVAADACVVQGRCLAYGDGITFWPLVQIVDDLGGADALETVLAAADDAATVAERVRAALGTTDVAAAGGEVAWAVRRLLETVARERPLVAILEDIHWAAPTFLDLLEYIVGWSRDAPIMLVCLARPELLDERPAWLDATSGTAIRLGPLSDAEACELLDEVAQEWPLDAAVRARIARHAEGNPLYVEQIAAMVAEEGAEVGTIPPTIHALLAARLDRLPAGERAVLERAAVAGKEFARAAVAALSPESELAGVHTHLLSLLRKDLLAANPASPDDAFRFRHALIRDAAYAGIPKELRAEQHESFADWAAMTAAGRAGALDEIVGYHLEQGHRYRTELGMKDERTAALGERAGTLLGAAGQRAFARDDMPAARGLLDRAVALLRPDDHDRLELMRELGCALWWGSGEIDRADAIFREVIEEAARLGDRRIEWYAQLDRATRRILTEPDSRVDDLVAIAEEAVRVFTEIGDSLGLARAHRALGQVEVRRCHYAAAQQHAELALTHAARAGDGSEQARSVDVLCTALLFGPAPAESAIARCGDLLASGRGNLLFEANVSSSLAGLLAMQRRFPEARATARSARAIFEELGVRMGLVGLGQIVGPVELGAGDPEAAEHELRSGFDVLSAARATALLPTQGSLLAHVLISQGRPAEAAAILEIAESSITEHDVSSQALVATVCAQLALARDEPDLAETRARAALVAATTTDAVTLHADARSALAEALARLGRADEAARERYVARELYRAKGNIAALDGVVAHV